MTFNITQVDELDFTDDHLVIGDDSEFVDKMTSILNKLQNWTVSINQGRIDLAAELDLIQANLRADAAMQYNALPYHGAFIIPADNLTNDFFGNPTNGAPFDGDALKLMFNEYNDTDLDTIEEADRYIYNSSTYGGNQEAISALVQNFVNRIGNGSRFAYPWAVAELTAGVGTAGTSPNDNGTYQFLRCNGIVQLGINGRVSFAFWYSPVGTDAWIAGSSAASPRSTYLDGVRLGNTDGEAGDAFHRLTAGQVYHIAGTVELAPPLQSENDAVLLYGTPGAKHRFAMPWIVPGIATLPEHYRAVRSFDTVAATTLLGPHNVALQSSVTDVQTNLDTVEIDLQAEITDAIVEAYTDVSNDKLNLFMDSGSFLEYDHASVLAVSGHDSIANHNALFNGRGFDHIFDNVNGSSIQNMVEVSRWHYNSSDFGGPEPANTGDARAILEHIGAANRYTTSFAVGEIVTGDGTTGASYNNCSRFFSTNSHSYFGVDGRVSFSLYFISVDGDSYVQAFEDYRRVYIDGVKALVNEGDNGTEFHRLNAGQIYHLAFSLSMGPTEDRVSSFPAILSPSLSRVRVALPWLAAGAFQMKPHARVIRGLNTVDNPPAV